MKVFLIVLVFAIGVVQEGRSQAFDTSAICKTYKHPLGHKVWKSAKIIFVADIATMGLLAALPPEFSNWNKDFFKESFKTFGRTFVSLPVWDHDPWYVNYVGHPVGGALYYNTLRSQGASQLHSFLFSLGESTFYEYVIEAIAERASVQDLICTPLGGYILGEVTHRATMKMRNHGFTFIERVATLLINPMYVINNGFKVDKHCNTLNRYLEGR